MLSADEEVDLQVMGLNAASMALYLSDIPVNETVCGVRVGMMDGEFVLNPSNSELEKSSLDLYVAGVRDELLMIEMRSIAQKSNNNTIASDPLDNLSEKPGQYMNEFDEGLMLKAIEFAGKAIENGSRVYEETFKSHIKELVSLDLNPEIEDESIAKYIEENCTDEVKFAINQMAKSERAGELNQIVEKILTTDIATQNEWQKDVISKVLDKYKRKIVRKQIVETNTRADGRGLKEIRPISIETNLLPSAHGSCLFTRGQTQALVIATLGSDNDAQTSDLLTQKEPVNERFMVNYNFPGFSVGEASPLRSPGRRELGHGNLAKRALAPSVDMQNPEVIRLVSEILESNGSSSMATVCGGSLALRAAGINTYKLVAGIAMGLIFEDGKHAVLSDIMGLEDHDGDMDFKVAGSLDGITALQMDIKLGGISLEVLKEALYQAKEGREHILSIMTEADLKIVINEEILPKTEIFMIDPSKMVDIIGQGGKTIKGLVDEYSVTIDLDRDSGEVKILGSNKTNVAKAKEDIIEITKKDNSRPNNRRNNDKKSVKFEIGEEFEGEVKSIVAFGAFVHLKDGVDGLLHISQIKDKLKEGDRVKVKVNEQKGNKISLELA